MANVDDGFPVTALREIQYLKNLRHENIVNLQDVVVSYQEGDQGDKKVYFWSGDEKHISKDKPDVYLVFEYMEYDINGLIDKKIQFEVKQIKGLMLQLLKAVDYLHDNDIMHRDIKGANILLNSEGTLKLADFGLAKQYDQFRKLYTNKVVTLWYRAPELLLGSYQYNKNIDVWSVGGFFAELFIGRPLFPGDCESKQIDLIFRLGGTPSLETWPSISYLNAFAELNPKNYPNTFVEFFKNSKFYPDRIDDQGIDLLEKMLTMGPDNRIDVKDCLKHSYFSTEPLPGDKSELPKIEGEAHEHAIREEKKEIQLAEEEKKLQHQPIYPMTRTHGYPTHGPRNYHKDKNSEFKHSGSKRTRTQRDNY